MISFANAKINLGLFITEKRSDGFHNLESIFLPVNVADVLEIIPTNNEAFSFQTVGIEIDGDTNDNLCVKAYHLLKKDFDIPGFKSCLLKNIPIGAGLGGGSSDGVKMMKALNELFELKISETKLLNYASQLGSDCPFFVRNQPAYVSGSGDVMEPINVDLSGVHVVVVHPGIHVSTKDSYGMIKPSRPSFDLRTISSLDRKDWQQKITNDFEAPMIAKFPVIDEIKKAMIDNGAFYASMSGSGSAVYGFFQEEKQLGHLWPEFFYRNASVL